MLMAKTSEHATDTLFAPATRATEWERAAPRRSQRLAVAPMRAPGIRGARILAIDDVKEIHTFVRAVLEHRGHKVFSALDASQATKMARELLPDLVLLDIAMPGGGGYVVFQRLRMLQGTARIPILVYSAKPQAEVTQVIPEGPDVVFLSKPAGPEELVDAVEGLLGAALSSSAIRSAALSGSALSISA